VRPAHRLRIAAFFVASFAAGCSTSPGPLPSAGGTAAAQPSTGAAALALVVDTDMAPDDITAIASLLRDPAVDLRAITVAGTGEAHCPGGMFVARSIVTMLVDRQIPVACGNRSPLTPAEEFPPEWRAAVDAGSGLDLVRPGYVPDSRSAPDLLVELARAESAAGGRLTVLTLGTLTNVATALAADPDLPSQVRLVSMLGAVHVPGNVTTQPGDATAEWNAHADPTAVRRVLEAGFDWTLVPLDATNSVPLRPELAGELARDHAAGPADLVFELWARNPYMTGGGFYLWDPLASAVVRDAAIATVEPIHLFVTEGTGPDGGRLREDPAGHAVMVALAADQSRFESLLIDRLRRGTPRSNAFTPVARLNVTAGVGRCEVRFDPASPSAGLHEIDLSNAGTEPVNAIVFELGGVSWPVVAAYVQSFDPAASPPPVTVLTQLGLQTGASTTATSRHRRVSWESPASRAPPRRLRSP
jgi:pyrimidine-specific ribonucleoside hydrolase